MEEQFLNILEKDEQIIKVIKPKKSRYWKQYLTFAIPIFWPHALILLAVTLFTFPYWLSRNYKNTYYAYTTKRLIVRSGYIGVDYTSLEYKDVTSTNVTVGFLDTGSNTGSLSFSSPSVHAGKPLAFNFIENPYEHLKEIKNYMNEINS